MPKTIRIKRIYDPAHKDDGTRILVDRLWPRGMSKDRAKLHAWIREIAPSDALRKWYRHDHGKWGVFKSRYFEELNQNAEQVEKLLDMLHEGANTLLFSSKETQLNNAGALMEYLAIKGVP